MQIETILLILLAGLASLAIVWYQYYYATKSRGNWYLLVSFLRFLAFFGLFLLLINPKFTKYELSLEKTHLVVLVDNSTSITAQQGANQITSILNQVEGNNKLSEKFNIKHYSFGSGLNDSSHTSFSEKSTNIAKALARVNTIYGKSNKAIILLTDGNQTLGEDYEFSSREQKSPIYPVAVGDTTRYQDLRVDYVNSNSYAFLRNKYPLEIFTSYEGESTIASTITVAVDGKTVVQERIGFSKANTKGTI